jgi:oxygen-independent coproporphyrinogen-3 oxidase
MSGIYLHIPFCQQACYYCDFHFSTSLNQKDAFLAALELEIKERKNYLSNQDKVDSIYFGGGTPSLLSEIELMRIFDLLYETYNVAADVEITLEANPEDLNVEKIKALKRTPINRFSIGIQSFFETDLKFMNRAHTSERAESAVKASQDAGFENISIDLIYGTPTLSNENWLINLSKAFSLQVKHISAYCLTVEEKTALHHMVTSGKVKNIDEEKSAGQFEILLQQMKANYFKQYEISNFCTDSNFSRHNSNYWKRKSYIGFGPSAHSYNGVSRQWNVRNNALYIQGLQNKKLNFEKEELSKVQNYNEYILTSIRTMWGSDLTTIETDFGADLVAHCKKEAAKYLQSHHLIESENHFFLTESGKLLADKITSDLFFTEKL